MIYLFSIQYINDMEGMQNIFFTESANSVMESQCPFVCLSVCLFVCLSPPHAIFFPGL